MLAAGLMAGAVACSGAPETGLSAKVDPTPAATGPAAEPAATAALVTPEQAREVFATITSTDNLARAMGSHMYAEQLNRDGQNSLTSTAFQVNDGRPPTRAWGPPEVFVPRFTAEEGSPWFTALATRDGRPTLLTFVRGDSGWRLSLAAELVPGEKAPEVALDAEGYATVVPPEDKSVLIGPKFMAPLHATVAETGSGGVAAELLTAGPYTTEVAAKSAADRKKWELDGYSYDAIFTPGDNPVYALRTADGGALIQYTLTRATTTTPATKSAESEGVPVPREARWAIDVSRARRSLKIYEVNQYATAVPPATSTTRATVIARDGAIHRAVGE
ncbi:lipoprotein [Nonomuraea longicatena]|uniref:Lipoprotein n=2 Tax=Nonomuraea longicatena TaxID=83682 RepID=A0ABP4BBG5_9ACTN